MQVKNKTAACIASIALLAGATIVISIVVSGKKKRRDVSTFDPYGGDPIDLYIEESFPASDAPGYSPISRIGRP